MGTWKSRGGKSQRREEQKREDQSRERVRRKKMQVREKVAKSRNNVFFQWFVAPEGWNVGSLKRRVRSHVARWEVKNCTPLWREAHLQVKKLKTPHVRSIFWSWDVEKVHAIVARSTFASEKAKNFWRSDHFWKLRCRKSARHCDLKHISKSKVLKADRLGALLEVEMLKKIKSARRCGAKHMSKSKCTKHTTLGKLLAAQMSKSYTPLRREAHFEVKMYKTHHSRSTCGRSGVVLRGRHKGFCTLLKVSKTWGFCSMFKSVGRRGTLEEDP